MNNCKNLKQRTRTKNKRRTVYLYCAELRKEITFDDCRGCEYKEYKNNTKLKAKTSIKKINKKRRTVSDKTYNIVLDRSKDFEGVPHCQYCRAVDNLQLHHVIYRSERKDLIDDPDNCLMLCHRDFSINKCHRIVHNNKKKYQEILLDILDKIKKG